MDMRSTPARDGRQAHALQVRREERGIARIHRHLHAKPLFQENGSGMHCHQSLWKGGEPLFFGTATAACRTSGAGTWVGCSSTLGVLAFGARPPTRTSGWCRATRRRSTWCIPSATVGRLPYPAVLAESEGQADRVPVPRRLVEPVPGVPRHAVGRPRRCPKPDRAARPLEVDLFDLPAEELANIRTRRVL